jgi:hypothetical protein
MMLTGLKIRKAIELELNPREIFNISLEPDGDELAKEMYEENINHSSEIVNKEEVFGKDFLLIYYDIKKIIKINENLEAYVFNSYLSHLIEETYEQESKIINEKNEEVIFLNTKILNYNEFLKNVMDAHSFLGKFEKKFFKIRFSGVGSFNMEDYALNHTMISMSDVHFLDFFIKDSNLVSTISMIITANYETDIIEQKEYFDEEEYKKMLETVKKHKSFILKGLSLGLK